MTDSKSNTGYCNTGNYNTGNCNTSSYNTGNCNTGNYNTGYRNTGYRNTGDYNTGDYNTGDCNTGNYNTGSFNTSTPERVNFFNKPCLLSDWDKASKPIWIYNPSPTTWVSSSNMSQQEREDNPTYKTTGGYLRENDIKEEWVKALDTATEEEIQQVRDLPNFDYEVFEEITGLDLRVKAKESSCEGSTVVVNGVEYTLVKK